MPDPNARRDKALESIARELGEVNKHLKRIADNGRRVTFTNSPYLERSERPDELGEDTDITTGPYGSKRTTGNPTPGPYGTGTSRPYQ